MTRSAVTYAREDWILTKQSVKGGRRSFKMCGRVTENDVDEREQYRVE